LELQAGFNLAQFRHHASYNEAAGRIEMHVVSRRPQLVPVDGVTFAFAQGVAAISSRKETATNLPPKEAKATVDQFTWVDRLGAGRTRTAGCASD